MAGKARAAALAAIERCRRNGAWSSASIDGVIKKYTLDRRDAALASRLCLGVLQNCCLCDHYLSLFCSMPLSRLEPKVLDILRLGAYQLLFTDKIPANAAVSESVSLCRELCGTRPTGLVNAVLRKLASEKDHLPDVPGRGTAGYLSIKYSHPLWLCERLIDCKGFDFTEQFLKKNNEPTDVSVQINTLKTSTEDYVNLLLKSGTEFELSGIAPDCVCIKGGSIIELPGFSEGLFYVQDPAAKLCAAIAGVSEGMKVLDACAAPGGKSFAAAIRMKGVGSIISCDIHEKKLGLISAGAERLGIGIISTALMDARVRRSEFVSAFDAVIADVPCSGMGVIRKKPEIRQKNAAELSELPKIQLDIINNLADYVNHGGVLLYSTCTVLPEENEELVEAFLTQREDYSLEGFSLPGADCPEGMHTFWPNVDGTDGFFAAKLRRR